MLNLRLNLLVELGHYLENRLLNSVKTRSKSVY